MPSCGRDDGETTGKRVKIGLNLGMLNPGMWLTLSEQADELGFESVWIPEHLVFPVHMHGSPTGDDHPPVPPTTPAFDLWVFFAAIGARTTNIRLGSFVYNIGLRHPFVTARAVATADVLSNGRIEFGIGASWLAEEWNAVGLDFATRGKRVDEAVDVCRRVWTDRVIEYHGEHFDFEEVMFEPKPVQVGGPPVLVGGDTTAALNRAARLGDGWIPLQLNGEQLRAARDTIETKRQTLGRSGRFETTMALPVQSDADLEQYAKAGVDRVVVNPWSRSREAPQAITDFARRFL
jgi:probable F420-dependent oxidoreductase